ncbi:hypothetical protein GCM10023084_17710 [Streptomyces lacrimifluminis]|uniref:Peptidase S1 domain-containing protein n=2 Tax=Streptomyces lacrimifluminis TaxID=1500077 RepID=A0A917NL70_9ACTN|nr:hypothetical protein GCM10012282_02080 [Streptomyces lacrimifluminis]
MDRGGRNDPCWCDGKFTTPGDSGAPVYVEGQYGDAWIAGIHNGSAWIDGKDRMVNTRAWSILEQTNSNLVFGDS